MLVAIEALSWGGSEYLAAKGVFYEPQPVEDYARYERERDPITGWPRRYGDGERDESGARIESPAPDTRASCLSLYGDSWTWGGDDPERAWGHVLSQLLGCRVANYGVNAYGSDQAYLRFVHNEMDNSPVVFLGHLTENILRNVNQLRGLLSSQTRYGLKPRFVLGENGELLLIPLPTPSEREFQDLVADPEKYLAHEFFVPGGPSGTAIRRFPYALSVLAAFRHFHVVAEMRGEPWHAAFYAPDHPSRGLEITARIMEAFHREAVRRGQIPIPAVIPTGLDLAYHRKNERWVYASLIDRLDALGLEVFDLGPVMLEAIGAENPCAFFEDGNCSRHPNERGNAMIAHLVRAYLEEKRLIPARIDARTREQMLADAAVWMTDESRAVRRTQRQKLGKLGGD